MRFWFFPLVLLMRLILTPVMAAPTYPSGQLGSDEKIDVLVVMDNSRSMQRIHDKLIAKAETLFEQFVNSGVDWKLGIISTSVQESPYLGFDSPFDSSMIDPNDPATSANAVRTFNVAVDALGLRGDVLEYIFYNTKRALDVYGPTTLNPFLRENAHLAVIMISDEPEQSEEIYGSLYQAQNFYDHIKQYIESDKVLRFYGIFMSKDLKDCQFGYRNYAGSPFEEIIDLSDGLVASACTSPIEFGDELAEMARDITSLVGTSSSPSNRGPLSSEERYEQIVQDFAQGTVPDIELLTSSNWRAGRCVHRRDPARLYPAAFEMIVEHNGPYYGTVYKPRLYYSRNRNPNFFDGYSDASLDTMIHEHGTHMLISDTIWDYHQSVRFSDEGVLLVSLMGDGMCYFFDQPWP